MCLRPGGHRTQGTRTETWGDENGDLLYDANGNLTNAFDHSSEFNYDDENRLTNFFSPNGVGASYFTYDGLGRLRVRLEYVPSEDDPDKFEFSYGICYIYGGMRVIQERDATVNTPLVSYTRGSDLSGSMEGAGGIGGLLARSCGYSGGNFSTNDYYFADGNGNVTYMIDSSQAMVASYRYDPFGNETAQSGSMADANVYRFSSKEFHPPTGMYYYGYRFYWPFVQRWLNRDPLQDIPPGVISPLSRPVEFLSGANLYSFLRNSPIDYFDRDGRVAGTLLNAALTEALLEIERNCSTFFPNKCDLCCRLAAMGASGGATAAFVADMIESGVAFVANPLVGVADFIAAHTTAILAFSNQGKDYKECLKNCKCKQPQK